MDIISATAKKISNKLHTTAKILKFDQIRYPILDAFSVCIVQLILLTQTEVYRSLLHIYWDNISTPTSVMSFVVPISLRYSVSNKSSVATSVQI